ncbi:SGNH/GDSL hydrolase family protein [Fibrobacter sp. UWB5]|uniref:SGNH/GDSL hydrolase family protein n=1 Tax=Fibrobacter sp. UWB5 TaxID=1964360 RepID=UPI000B5226A6|nr:SGNH/GDSL hydrolase family protein [Fibrobacter sp. UWB5]OWV12182.1 esterase [Fibrobacter sp. UWB5]
MEQQKQLAGIDTAIKAATILSAVALLGAFTLVDAAENYKFDFGEGPVAAGYTQVKANTKYSDSQGYGFESGTVSSVDRLWDDDLTTDFLTAKGDMVFSVALPQGNYEVTFILGDGENESETTVWAENRKLMLDRITLAGGVFSRQTVSLRRMETRSMDGSVTMSIKDREKDYRTWDKKLTFVISGKAPAVAGIEIKRNDNVTTLWLCGNSTVVDQITAPWAGWGQMAPGFFKSSLAIANYAESGLTASGFYSMKRLAKILSEVKKGDFVTVQFAHNDQKNQNDVNNYEATLTKYANEIKAKGATPLFVTSTARQNETDPKTAVGGLPERMRALGKKLGVTVLDLNQHSITLGKALGGNKEKMYMYTASDKTHFCEYGAYELARANIEEIKAKVPELAKHLRDDHEAFDSSKPDPLDILTQAKTPITDGGLIQVEPESSSSEKPESSSSAEIAGPQSSSAAEGISSSAEGTEGTTAVKSLTPRNAIRGHIDGNTLRLESIDGGAHNISFFDMQGHRIAEFRAVQGSELHVTLRQGAYLVKVAQGNRTLGIFKAVRR